MEEHSYSGLKTPKQKRPWLKEEDENLLHLIDELGSSDWKEIGFKMESRSGKQCRERYFNHLKEGINKHPWTNEEDKIICDKYDEFGPRWSAIAKYVSGRPDNAVKNRWHLLHRKSSYTSPDANKPKVIGPSPWLGEKTVRFSDDHMLNKSNSADSNETVVANNFDRKSWKRGEIELLLSSVKDKQNWLQIGHLFPNRSILCIKQKFESIIAKGRKEHDKIKEDVTTCMSNTACVNISNAKRALPSPPVASSWQVETCLTDNKSTTDESIDAKWKAVSRPLSTSSMSSDSSTYISSSSDSQYTSADTDASTKGLPTLHRNSLRLDPMIDNARNSLRLATDGLMVLGDSEDADDNKLNLETVFSSSNDDDEDNNFSFHLEMRNSDDISSVVDDINDFGEIEESPLADYRKLKIDTSVGAQSISVILPTEVDELIEMLERSPRGTPKSPRAHKRCRSASYILSPLNTNTMKIKSDYRSPATKTVKWIHE